MPEIDGGRRATALAKGGTIEARYGIAGSNTALRHLREQGALRLRQPTGPFCQSVLVNTAGGIVGGDRMSMCFHLEPRSDVTVSSAAAEKVYRSDDATRLSVVDAKFSLAPESRLVWVPQETIFFDAARLRRSFVADLDATSELIMTELLVFGRKEHGEHDVVGHLHDSWRVRRNGVLVFADETRLDGAIGRLLARNAVAAGSHATAVLLVVGSRTPSYLEPVRIVIAAAIASNIASSAAGGATLKDGIIVARLTAPSAEILRSIVAAMLQTIGVAIPRVWK